MMHPHYIEDSTFVGDNLQQFTYSEQFKLCELYCHILVSIVVHLNNEMRICCLYKMDNLVV